MTPAEFLAWSELGLGALFGALGIFLYWQEVQAHRKTQAQYIAALEIVIKDRESMIARQEARAERDLKINSDWTETVTALRIILEQQEERRKR